MILKYIESEGKDPATGEELTADDLLPIKSSKGACVGGWVGRWVDRMTVGDGWMLWMVG